jgi:hypothetical protein
MTERRVTTMPAPVRHTDDDPGQPKFSLGDRVYYHRAAGSPREGPYLIQTVARDEQGYTLCLLNEITPVGMAP